MAGPGVITISAAGSLTSPSSISLSLGSAASPLGGGTAKCRAYQLLDAISLPTIRGVLLLNGIGLNFHTVEAVNYPTGILGVALAIAAASTAARATGTLDLSAGTPSDNDSYSLSGKAVGQGLKFKTTLPTSGIQCCILIGGSAAASCTNVQKFLNNTGQNGTDYYFNHGTYGTDVAAFLTALNINVSSVAGNIITHRAVDYGNGGNGYSVVVLVDTGAAMTASGTFTGGTAGTPSAPYVGTYGYRASRVRSADMAISYASPVVSITQSGNCNINLTSFVAANARDSVLYYRWYRTTSGGSVYFKGADVAVGTGEPFVDSYADTTLTGAFAVKYDDRIYRPYTSGYPVKCSYGCTYKGRVFMGGARLAAQRTQGTASVPATSAASYAVTMTLPAHPTVDWIGRTFRVANDTQDYIIVDVTENTRVLTLNLPFNGTGAYNAGAANATASYTVTDDRNPFTVYYSEPNLVNNWPTNNSLEGKITSKDASGISGMRAQWGIIAVWTQTGLHKLDGDTGSGFRMEPVGEGMGAYSNQSIVEVKGTLYWMGPNGIFEWGGSGEPKPLVEPVDVEGPIGIERTYARINAMQRDIIVGNFNETENVIRWFVPMDGESQNRYVIVFDLVTRSFSIDTCENVTSACTVPDDLGILRTLAGTAHGEIFQLDLSASDGAFGFERVNAVTSAIGNTVTCSGATFPTTGGALAGVPVWHYAVSGSVQPQRRKIISNTGTVLTLESAFDTTPVATDTLIVGGIGFDIQTGRWDLAESYKKRGLPAVSAMFVPSTGQLWCAAATDNGTPTVYAPGTVRGFSAADYADVSTTDGFKLFWFRRGKARRICVRFFGFTLGSDFGLVGWAPTVAQAEMVGG